MNSITDLLDLEDANISISSIDIEGQTKTIYLETAPVLNGVSDYNPVTYFEEDEF